eukprot:Pgem_evm1s2303
MSTYNTLDAICTACFQKESTECNDAITYNCVTNPGYVIPASTCQLGQDGIEHYLTQVCLPPYLQTMIEPYNIGFNYLMPIFVVFSLLLFFKISKIGMRYVYHKLYLKYTGFEYEREKVIKLTCYVGEIIICSVLLEFLIDSGPSIAVPFRLGICALSYALTEQMAFVFMLLYRLRMKQTPNRVFRYCAWSYIITRLMIFTLCVSQAIIVTVQLSRHEDPYLTTTSRNALIAFLVIFAIVTIIAFCTQWICFTILLSISKSVKRKKAKMAVNCNESPNNNNKNDKQNDADNDDEIHVQTAICIETLHHLDNNNTKKVTRSNNHFMNAMNFQTSCDTSTTTEDNNNLSNLSNSVLNDYQDTSDLHSIHGSTTGILADHTQEFVDIQTV